MCEKVSRKTQRNRKKTQKLYIFLHFPPKGELYTTYCGAYNHIAMCYKKEHYLARNSQQQSD